MLKNKDYRNHCVNQRRSRLVHVGRSSFIATLLILFSLMSLSNIASAHSTIAHDDPPFPWHFVSQVSIHSGFNGDALTAYVNSGGKLLAYTNIVNLWELYDLFQFGNANIYAFRAKVNNLFVEINQNDINSLYANGSAINTQAMFEIDTPTSSPYGPCSIKALGDGLDLSLRLNENPNDAPVEAFATSVSGWEEFAVTSVGSMNPSVQG